MLTPVEAGTERVQRVLDALGHLLGAGARELLHDQDEAGGVGRHRVTDERLVVGDDVGHVAELDAGVRAATGTAARSAAVEIGRMCWMASRWFGLSTKPPVPGVLAWTKLSGDTHSALPVVVVTSASDTCRACMRYRVGLDLQLPVALAVDRHVGDPGHTHQPRPDLPPRQDGQVDQDMPEPAFGDRPIIEIRTVEDNGCIITGGVPTLGRARIWVIRSWTSWRAAAVRPRS